MTAVFNLQPFRATAPAQASDSVASQRKSNWNRTVSSISLCDPEEVDLEVTSGSRKVRQSQSKLCVRESELLSR